MLCKPRSIAASKPSVARASVLATIMKFLLLRASMAAPSFSAYSSCDTTSLPCICPHLLGQRWSSRKIPDAPADSNSLTNFQTLSAFPYPVSASTITGTDTARQIRLALSTVSAELMKP